MARKLWNETDAYKTEEELIKEAKVSKSASVTGSTPKPRHRLCWWCNLQFRGNHFATRTIDGHEREIHKRCAKLHDKGIEPKWELG
jgi:hypothetical protein